MKRKYMSMIFGVVFMISRMPLLMNVYAQEPGVRYVSFIPIEREIMTSISSIQMGGICET